jgi:hypothetical protein
MVPVRLSVLWLGDTRHLLLEYNGESRAYGQDVRRDCAFAVSCFPDYTSILAPDTACFGLDHTILLLQVRLPLHLTAFAILY